MYSYKEKAQEEAEDTGRAWGSKSTVDWYDESMEVTKDLQKNCSSVLVKLN
jgi:hypothetical protein